MVNSIDNSSKSTNMDNNFKVYLPNEPKKKEHNWVVIAGAGAAGALAGSVVGVKTAKTADSVIGLTKDEQEWYKALRASVVKDGEFDMGMYQDAYYTELSDMSDNAKDALMLDGRVKELHDSNIKSRDYKLTLERLTKAKNAIDETVKKFTPWDLNMMVQNNMINPIKWQEAIFKQQKAKFSIPIANEFNFIKKFAFGGILGTATGFILNRYLVKKNK